MTDARAGRAALAAVVLAYALPASAAARSADPAPPTYDGRGAPRIDLPRLEEDAAEAVAIDGNPDEPAWSRAARLTGFSQYQPIDERPAQERTEVLVWYSPTALYFAVLADDRDPSSVRATVADRDRLDQEDTVEAHAFNRVSFFGPTGSLFESARLQLNLTRYWRYAEFLQGPPVEGTDNPNVTLLFRGGWNIVTGLRRDFFRFSRADYARY